ncbi:hypothetical protein F506_00175 [Herbaspirillum hiltneri N3]|uniref:Uncharacterized protein n=1 Tax=Herbaspirillum hiltneri N3 TaxID=1262470 RepID=A0ABM5UVP8_9BURK|nr:hypothetical protein [Herbaspirillum hiltneri]AKZ61289.1 hypothetical protein F506_00175 [Herbaspirillum hiltneri N3]
MSVRVFLRLFSRVCPLSLFFLFVLSFIMTTAHAETWTHVSRNTEAKIGPTDPGSYDEYLDTDYIGYEGEWTLIRVKSVMDDPANEFHGKLELSTWAISCRQYKMGMKDYKAFREVHDAPSQPAFQQVSERADIERLARNFLPLNKDAVITIWYMYACLGIRPANWAEAKENMFSRK